MFYDIRTDYRAALDVCNALADPALSDREKAYAVLVIIYPDFDGMPPAHHQEALEKAIEFINAGEAESGTPKRPKLVDWQQDFKFIVAPVNKVIGHDIRGRETLHWWTFLSAYMEIGDCTFAQIVRIRDALARGKKLDKTDREWYRQNRAIVDIKTKYTDQETETLKKWGV